MKPANFWEIDLANNSDTLNIHKSGYEFAF